MLSYDISIRHKSASDSEQDYTDTCFPSEISGYDMAKYTQCALELTLYSISSLKSIS